jgi:pyruvate kinase
MAPILSITPKLTTARRLALVWGVHSTVSADIGSIDEVVSEASRIAQREGFAW